MVEENNGFKVADKRHFTEDGELKREAATESTETRGTFPETPSTVSSSEVGTGEEIPIEFNTLVISFSTSAMVQLGILPNPVTGKKEQNLAEAKQTIDMLLVLQEKTQGNLNSEEKQLLEASLYDLKMAYLQLSSRITL